jgi:hypothetical protein
MILIQWVQSTDLKSLIRIFHGADIGENLGSETHKFGELRLSTFGKSFEKRVRMGYF